MIIGVLQLDSSSRSDKSSKKVSARDENFAEILAAENTNFSESKLSSHAQGYKRNQTVNLSDKNNPLKLMMSGISPKKDGRRKSLTIPVKKDDGLRRNSLNTLTSKRRVLKEDKLLKDLENAEQFDF